jgi:hypothetical protein
VSKYPFNDHRDQVDPDHCPAPFCGRPVDRGWWTPVTFAEDAMRSFADSAARPLDDFKAYKMLTCTRDDCRTWARMRAADLRGGPKADPFVVSFQWTPYYRGEVDIGGGIRIPMGASHR